jgi:hypothetical protein
MNSFRGKVLEVLAFAFLADYSPPQSDGVTRQDSNMKEIAEEEKNGYVVIKICVHESFVD